MSAAVVVLRDDAVVVAADRAAVADGVALAAGYPWPRQEGPKLAVLDSGCVVATLGKASVVLPDGPDLDLRTVARSAASNSAVLLAAVRVRAAFQEVADTVREHAGRGEFKVPPLARPVLTVAIVAGVEDGYPVSYVVGLTPDGPCLLRMLDASTAFAPEQALTNLQVATLNATVAATVADARTLAVAGIRYAAAEAPGFVSPDVDWVELRPGAACVSGTDSLQQKALPPGV